MKTNVRKLTLGLLLTVALPTMVFATDGAVSLFWSPLSSMAVSPGQSVTLTLQMVVTGFTGSDKVAGYDFALTSLNDPSGNFFIQSRTISPTTPFPEPQTEDAILTMRPGANLDPTNGRDLGAAVSNFPNNLVGDGTYVLQTLVVGLDRTIVSGTYNFSTSRNLDGAPGFIWTDEKSDEFTVQTGAEFALVVAGVSPTPTPPTPTATPIPSSTPIPTAPPGSTPKPPLVSTPEAGSTILLFAVALCGLGLARRKLTRRS